MTVAVADYHECGKAGYTTTFNGLGNTVQGNEVFDVLFFLVIVVSECHSFLLECSIS